MCLLLVNIFTQKLYKPNVIFFNEASDTMVIQIKNIYNCKDKHVFLPHLRQVAMYQHTGVINIMAISSSLFCLLRFERPYDKSWEIPIQIELLGKITFHLKNNITYSSCLLYTSPSPRDGLLSRMPSSA